MPLVDRKSNLVSANSRASDVACRLTETIAPIQQQRTISAFRVQGLQAVHYHALNSGRICPCQQQNNKVEELAPTGTSSTGAVNRILTGQAKFGARDYSPLTPEDEFNDDNNFKDASTSPNDALSQWLGDLDKAGGNDDFDANFITDESIVADNGQHSPDLDDIFKDFDLSKLGVTDISCPICFGTTYIGGYAPYRSWRQVLVGADFQTDSTFELPSFALTPGSHVAVVTFPLGAVQLDVFRTFNDTKITYSEIIIDGVNITQTNGRILSYFDGQPHTVEIRTEYPMTHLEMQASMSREPVYFEFPRRLKSGDVALLEKTEPFQILMSPEVPALNAMDIIVESQQGKVLIVGIVNDWVSRDRNLHGWECQVRVAQPQELWRILPHRLPLTGQKTTNARVPSSQQPTSGFRDPKSFSF